MHISEGVLSPPVLAAGAALAIAGVSIGLRRLDESRLARCALLSAVFFVGSLVHVPIGFASAHLMLCGLLGIFLGWGAFPAIFVALLLQAILFQYGGLTTLGVNTFTMGSAAVAAYYIFRILASFRHNFRMLWLAGFCAGFLSVAFSAILTALALAFTDEGFEAAAYALLLAHAPVMFIEGIITAFTAAFVRKVKPRFLNLPDVS